MLWTEGPVSTSGVGERLGSCVPFPAPSPPSYKGQGGPTELAKGVANPTGREGGHRNGRRHPGRDGWHWQAARGMQRVDGQRNGWKQAQE